MATKVLTFGGVLVKSAAKSQTLEAKSTKPLLEMTFRSGFWDPPLKVVPAPFTSNPPQDPTTRHKIHCKYFKRCFSLRRIPRKSIS